jgi:hypothetical protein
LWVLRAEPESGMGSMRPLLADRETAANPLRLLTAPAFFLARAHDGGRIAVLDYLACLGRQPSPPGRVSGWLLLWSIASSGRWNR